MPQPKPDSPRDDRLDAVLDTLSSHVIVADAEGVIINVSAGLVAMFEEVEEQIREELPDFSVDTLVGSNIDIFHATPSRQRRMLAKMKGTHEARLGLAGLTFDLRVTPMHDHDGELRGYVTEWRDMTKALVTEAEKAHLARDLARIRAGLDGARTNVMLANENLEIVYVNASLREMLTAAESTIQKDLPGFSVEGLIGRSIDDFHKNPSHQRGILKKLSKTHETRLAIAGRTFDLVINPSHSDDGELLGFAVEWADMTDKLAQEEERATLLLESMRVRRALDGATTSLMMVADADLNITYMNEGLEALFTRFEADIQRDLPQFSAKDLIGTNIDTFHVNPAHQRRILGNLKGRFKATVKLGGRIFNLVAGSLQDAAHPDVDGYCVEWVDVTDQVLAQEDIGRVIAAASDGDLTQRVQAERYGGMLRSIGEGLNGFIDSISDAFRQVKVAVEQIGQASVQLRTTSQMMSASSNQLNRAAVESDTALGRAADMARSNAENAAMANQLVTGTSTAARDGQERMEAMSSAMAEINGSAQQIAKIIKVIDEIAFQTNLLALNAAVEAARAGRYGKGFAVVAQEVRSLAERSAKAAKETTTLIEDSVSKVGQGVKIADATRTALDEIVGNVVKVVDLAGEIATASEEQSRTLASVTDSMGQVTEGAQAGSQQSTEVASAAEEMGRQMDVLQQRLAGFELTEVAASAGDGMPSGVTPDMVNQILAMLRAQGAIPAAARAATPAPRQGQAKQEQCPVPKRPAPRDVLPLDQDERGFAGF